VDGQSFLLSIADGKIDQEGNVPIQITCRAEFGARSVCLIRGLTNRSFWHDYPEIEEMRANAISITPKVACDLIRHARQLGWDPEACKSNFEMAADHELLKMLHSSNPPDAG
jgi:hypothetical protein